MLGRLSKCATVFIAITMAVLGVQPAAADDGKSGSGRHDHEYLALGDSLPFGFSPLVDPRVAANFVGYPEDAAPGLRLALTNASCPGQTSSGFISLTGSDNGCFTFRGAGLPLHTTYSGTQLDFAVSYLRAHPRTRLVTLTLGANDLLLCAQSTADGCGSPAEITPVLQAYQQNLRTILKAIRKVYHRELVAVLYYSTDYRDARTTGSIAALNQVTTRVTRSFHGKTADGFGAFAAVAAGSGGDTCAAGLLIPLPTGGCDIHPSEAGAELLADTLAGVVRHSRSHDDRKGSLVGSANG